MLWTSISERLSTLTRSDCNGVARTTSMDDERGVAAALSCLAFVMSTSIDAERTEHGDRSSSWLSS